MGILVGRRWCLLDIQTIEMNCEDLAYLLDPTEDMFVAYEYLIL